MHPRSATVLRTFLLLVLVLAAGCAKPPASRSVFRWYASREAPRFDPLGPPDPLRDALGALLTHSLLRTDTLGRPSLDAAERVAISPDRKRYTFTLRPGLRFTDGRACDSDAFRAALLAGLARTDHGTMAWRLAAVRGVDLIRAKRPQPPIAITAPDPRTLVLELALPDSLLLEKLAMPGATAAWESVDTTSDWKHAIGTGPYRVATSDARGLVLDRVDGAGPDTVTVRFGIGVPRARAVLRGGQTDLLWPLPPSLVDQPLAPGWDLHTRAASPERRLTLVFRADVPPTTKLAARRVFAHGIERAELPRRLGAGAREIREWLPGAGPADLPALDQTEIQGWLDRGKLGRSVHATLAYDADGAGASLARGLQFDWARFGLYVDLLALRGRAFEAEALGGQTQMLLVEEQGLVPGLSGILAAAVMPLRGPAVGGWRSGWRTRDLDPWIFPRRSPIAPETAFAKQRMEEETVVLPLVALDWSWIERAGAPAVHFDPRLGPLPAAVSPPENSAIRR